jgi:hypothetical protein
MKIVSALVRRFLKENLMYHVTIFLHCPSRASFHETFYEQDAV